MCARSVFVGASQGKIIYSKILFGYQTKFQISTTLKIFLFDKGSLARTFKPMTKTLISYFQIPI